MSQKLKKRINPWMILLVIVIILGAFLIFSDLGRKSLWLDEIFSAQHSQQPLKNILFYNPPPEKMWNNSHPVLPYVCIYLSTRLGTSDFFVRLPSALFGIALIILIFFAGKTFFDYQTGVIAAFLSAIAGLLLAHAQEARMYPHFAFFSLLSLLFLFRILYDKDTKQSIWIGFILSVTANLYTHTFAVLVLGTQLTFIFTILTLRIVTNHDRKENVQRLVKLLCCFLFIALLSSPEFLKKNNLLKQYVGGETLARGIKYQWKTLIEILAQFTIYEYPVSIPLYSIFFITGLFASLYRRPGRFLMIVLWIAVPLIPLLVMKTHHFFNVRYIIFMLPVFLITTAYGIRLFFNVIALLCRKAFVFFRKVDLVFLFTLGLFLFMSFIIYPVHKTFLSGEKDNWKGLVSYLQKEAKDNDLIFADHNAYTCTGYYLNKNNMNNPFIHQLEEIEKRNPDSFWFSTYHSPPDIFPDNYKITDRQRFDSFMVSLYHFHRFEWFRASLVKISPQIIYKNKQMTALISLENPDQQFPQLVSLWLQITDTSSKEIYPSVFETVLLSPSEKITKNIVMSAPENPGDYNLTLFSSAPPCTFFPGSSRYYFQAGTLEKETNSPSAFILRSLSADPLESYIMYGPYIDLQQGNYTAFYIIKTNEISFGDEPCIEIDVVSNGGKHVFAKKSISINSLTPTKNYSLIPLSFILDSVQNIEFRVKRLASIDLACAGVVLQKKDPAWEIDRKGEINEQQIAFTVE